MEAGRDRLPLWRQQVPARNFFVQTLPRIGRRTLMLIQVLFVDKKIGTVSQGDLDRMIENGSIAAFRRLDSWAVIGRDPVRSRNRAYLGTERRGRVDESIPTSSAPEGTIKQT